MSTPKTQCPNCLKSFVKISAHKKCNVLPMVNPVIPQIVQQQPQEIQILPVIPTVITIQSIQPITTKIQVVYNHSYDVPDTMFDKILKQIPFQFHNYIKQIVHKLNINVHFISYTDSIKIYEQIHKDLSIQLVDNKEIYPDINVVKLFALNYEQFKTSTNISHDYTIVKKDQYTCKIPIWSYQKNPENSICVQLLLEQFNISQKSFMLDIFKKEDYPGQSILKLGLDNLLQKQCANSNLIILLIEPLYGSRYMTAVTIKEIQDLYNNKQWNQENTIHQVISQKISKQCRFYMDIDNLQELDKIDICSDQFTDDLTNILNSTLRYYGYQYINLQIGKNIHFMSTDISKSVHVHLDFYVLIEDLCKLLIFIKQQFVSQFKYDSNIIDKIFDEAPYNCSKKYSTYSTLRLAGFNKITDEKKDGENNIIKFQPRYMKAGKRLIHDDISIFSKILMQQPTDIANRPFLFRSCPFIQQQHFNFNFQKQDNSSGYFLGDISDDDSNNEEQSDINYHCETSKLEVLSKLQIVSRHPGYVEFTGICPVHNKQHSKTTKLYINNSFATCFKPQKSIKFKQDQKQLNPQQVDNVNIQQIQNQFNTIQYQQHFEYNQDSKYVNFNIQQSRNTFVISHCGTGKTHQIAVNIQKLLDKDKNLSVLFISTRVSFSESIVQTLNTKHKLNFELYNEKSSLANVQFLMIQVESLSRLERDYDVVIIDECLSVFNQLNSVAGSKPQQHINNVKCAINYSKYNIFMDAFLTYPLFQFYLQLLHDKEHQIICNRFKPYQGTPTQKFIINPKYQDEYNKLKDKLSKFEIIEGNLRNQERLEMLQGQIEYIENNQGDKVDIFDGQGKVTIINCKDQYKQFYLNLVDQLYNEQKKVFSIFDHRDQLLKTVKRLLEDGILQKDEIMEIHGDNAKQNDITNLKHIQEKRAFYRADDQEKHSTIKYVCYTKSLTVGVDSQVVDFKTGIHYLGCDNGTQYINSFELVQMMHRYRQVNTHFIYVPKVSHCALFYTTKGQVQTANKDLYSPWNLQKKVQKTDNYFYELKNISDHLQYQIILQSYQEQLKQQSIYVTVALLENMGYNIQFTMPQDPEPTIVITPVKSDDKIKFEFINNFDEFDICRKISKAGYNCLTPDELSIEKLGGKFKTYIQYMAYIYNTGDDRSIPTIDGDYDQILFNKIQSFIIKNDITFITQHKLARQIPQIISNDRHANSLKLQEFNQIVSVFGQYIDYNILNFLYSILTDQSLNLLTYEHQLLINQLLPNILLYLLVAVNVNGVDKFISDYIDFKHLQPKYQNIRSQEFLAKLLKMNQLKDGTQVYVHILKKCFLTYFSKRVRVETIKDGETIIKQERQYGLLPIAQQFDIFNPNYKFNVIKQDK